MDNGTLADNHAHQQGLTDALQNQKDVYTRAKAEEIIQDEYNKGYDLVIQSLAEHTDDHLLTGYDMLIQRIINSKDTAEILSSVSVLRQLISSAACDYVEKRITAS